MMPLSSSAKVLRVWPWLAAICSGLLYAGCFAPFNLIWLCWIALTPLMTAIWFSGNESRRPLLRNLALGYVAGLAFFWTSPFGPLRLSYAQPLNAKSTDRIQKLQFTFGTGF